MGRDLRGPIVFEHRVTAYLEEFFRGLGVRWERQAVAPQRDNILAWYEPAGAERTLVLEVHQDTVPTDGMTIDPFGAHVENGRLHGRGACDVKGGMAAMLAAFARLVREKPAGAARVVMACTVDEEFTFLGVRRLAQTDLRGGCAGPLEAVVAEPTGLDVVHAHKGAVRWDLLTAGKSCHSSAPERGVNAIYHMGGLLYHIECYAEELRATQGGPPARPGHAQRRPHRGRRQRQHRARPLPRRDRPPSAARRRRRRRGRPNCLLTFVSRAGDGIAFSFGDPWLAPPPPSGPTGSEELVARLLRAAEPVAGRRRVMAVPYGTDAGPLARTGVPCVVFGPGDIALAHTCDEWVPLEEVALAAEILYRVDAD